MTKKQQRSTKWHEQFKRKALADPETRAEYEAFSLQLDVALKLKAARKKAHLTQESVAERMHTQKPVIARLEAGGGTSKHSPSLKTLSRYAQAVGCDIKILLVKKKIHAEESA
jgi:DNA-binding XRE family transcriptional regulator